MQKQQTQSTDPYLDGKRAYQAGAKKSDCPYDDMDANATRWRAGWRDGQLSDQEYNKAA